jgi:hypothetical protein
VSDLEYLNLSDDFVYAPGADDFVHADLLAAAIIAGCQCYINQIIDRLDIITGTDNQLKDNIVRLRMLAQEVKEVLPGIEYFAQARAATTGDIALTGEQTVDGVALVQDDICLVKNQTDATENGVWVVSASNWARLAPLIDDFTPGGVAHVWVEEGDTQEQSSWVWQPASTDVIGTNDIEWILFHQNYIPTITSDLQDALQGTEGTPDNTNRFVTDEDVRLTVFDETHAGLVPVAPTPPAVCEKFLCEDGTWQVPANIVATGFMQVDIDNIMDDAGFITFNDTIGIRGLANPTDADHAANKAYVDLLGVSLTTLLSWKSDLDAINGLIECDGAGNYSAFAGTFATLTITGKLTVGGLIDPTGLELTPVASNPGGTPANTLWKDSGGGDWMFGASSLTSVFDLETALAAIDGVIKGDGGGNYAAAVLGDLPTKRGEINAQSASTPTPMATQNQWYKLLGFSNNRGNAQNMTEDQANNRITNDGTVNVLDIDFDISFTGDTNNMIVELAVAINGTPDLGSVAERKLATAADVGNAGSGGQLSVPANAQVEVWVRCTSHATVNVTMTNGRLKCSPA